MNTVGRTSGGSHPRGRESLDTSDVGFPGGSVGQKTCLAMRETQETWVQSLGREDPLEKGIATHSNVLA